MNKINLKTALLLLIPFVMILAYSCHKDNDEKPILETGTVTDVDSNVYKTVKIGNKWWMAENLRTKRYANGDTIEFISAHLADTVWSHKTKGAYCVIDNTIDSSNLFGYLYNFYAVADSRKLAPAGWHIPSDDEWKVLEMFLGMSQAQADSNNWRGYDQGNKLKIVGGSASYWMKSDDVYTIFGNNQSGFTALGGACRVFDGQWGDLTHTAFWWTSTTKDANAWYRSLDYNKPNVFRYYGPKTYGFSVRCVKD